MGQYTVVKDGFTRRNPDGSKTKYHVGQIVTIDLRDESQAGIQAGYLKPGRLHVMGRERNGHPQDRVVEKKPDWSDDQLDRMREIASAAGLTLDGIQHKVKSLIGSSEQAGDITFDDAIFQIRKQHGMLSREEVYRDLGRELDLAPEEVGAGIESLMQEGEEGALRFSDAAKVYRLACELAQDADEIASQLREKTRHGRTTVRDAIDQIRIEHERSAFAEQFTREEAEPKPEPTTEPDEEAAGASTPEPVTVQVGTRVVIRHQGQVRPGSVMKIDPQGIVVQVDGERKPVRVREADILRILSDQPDADAIEDIRRDLAGRDNRSTDETEEEPAPEQGA